MKQIDLISGARLKFMKIAPTLDALNSGDTQGGSLHLPLIHTPLTLRPRYIRSVFVELGVTDRMSTWKSDLALRSDVAPTTPQQNCRLTVDAHNHE